MGECDSNTNCSLNGIVKVCYEENNFRNDTFFCDCSNWHGWTGDNCDERTGTLTWLMITTPIFMVWSIFLIGTSTKTMILYFRTVGCKPFGDTNPIIFVSICTWMSSALVLTFHAIRIRSFYDSKYFEIIIVDSLFFEESDIVVRKYSLVADYAFILGIMLQSFASMLIILSWLDFLIKTTRVIHFEHASVSETTLKKVISTIILGMLFMFVILVSFEYLAEIVTMFIIMSMLLTIGYTIAYVRFKKRLTRFMQAESTRKVQALNMVRTSFRVNVICLLLITLSTVAYYILSANRNQVIPIGGFNYALPFYDLAILSGFIMLTYTSYYSFKVATRLAKISGEVAWIPFFDSYIQRHHLKEKILEPPGTTTFVTATLKS